MSLSKMTSTGTGEGLLAAFHMQAMSMEQFEQVRMVPLEFIQAFMGERSTELVGKGDDTVPMFSMVNGKDKLAACDFKCGGGMLDKMESHDKPDPGYTEAATGFDCLFFPVEALLPFVVKGSKLRRYIKCDRQRCCYDKWIATKLKEFSEPEFIKDGKRAIKHSCVWAVDLESLMLHGIEGTLRVNTCADKGRYIQMYRR